jgi:hypothetical protein
MRKQLARYSLLVMLGIACLMQTLAFLFGFVTATKEVRIESQNWPSIIRL